jgi:hypothetical protein
VRAVFCQDEFADVTTDVVDWMLTAQLTGVYCRTGYHRAATVAEASSSLLNFTGHKALHLSLAGELAGDIEHSVNVAFKWLENPWAGPQPQQWPNLKAKALTRPEAWNSACLLEVSRYTFSISILGLVDFRLAFIFMMKYVEFASIEANAINFMMKL